MQYQEPEEAAHMTPDVLQSDDVIRGTLAYTDISDFPENRESKEDRPYEDLAIDNRDTAPICIDTPLEVRWDGDNDLENPRNFSMFRKWVIVGIVSLSCLCVSVKLFSSAHETYSN